MSLKPLLTDDTGLKIVEAIEKYTASTEELSAFNAELTDGRVDKDGVTHPNIGEHIRNVTGQLSEDIDVIYRDINPTEVSIVWASGGLISDNGKTTSYKPRTRTGFMLLEDMLVRVASGGKCIAFYYGEEQHDSFLGCGSWKTGAFRTEGKDVPSGTVYIRLMFGYDDDRDIKDVSEAAEMVSVFRKSNDSEILLTFSSGSIDTNGEATTNYTRIHTDDFIPVQPICFAPDGIKYLLAFYDTDQAFLSRTHFTESPTFINEIAPEGSAYFKVVIGDVNDIVISNKILLYTDKFHAYLPESLHFLEAAIAENKAAIAENIGHINALSNSIFNKTLDVDFISGGIQVSTDGTNNALNTRIRTDFIDEINLKITTSDDVKVSLCFYTANGAYISGASYENTPVLYAITVAPEGAWKVRIVAAYITNEVITDVDVLASKIEIKSATTETEYKNDIPENIGVLNAILNYKQLIEVEYETLGVIPHVTDGFMKVGKYRGIPYSSTRFEASFVPNNVSLHTFLTAVKNPNSYLYTVDLGEQGNINGDTYYGAVCSTSIGYAFNLIPMYSTHQWATIPDMEIIENQSAYGLKLCDTIVGEGHVVMVTDITRNKRGKIGYITISEAVNPRVKSTNYTPEKLEERFPPADYTYCRYKKLYAVKHTQSPYVAVEDETPQEVTYNTAIIPRRGDKANWLVGTDVEIDVLEAGSYTSVEIYKDDALLATKDIAALITLSGLGYGSYKARLTDGTNTSEWCYWMMVDAVSTAVPVGSDGKINVSFSASNATPLYVQWASGTSNGTVHITELSTAEVAAGSAECTYQSGSYKPRVAFRTEYGIILSVLPEAITVT